jgi:hypothetical protein
MKPMGDRAWQVPRELFVGARNAATSPAEVVESVKRLAGGHVPKWAVTARRGTQERWGGTQATRGGCVRTRAAHTET